MLDGIDALVFDIQDVGARFYTYITTLGYCLEAAGKKGIAFYVLDRPNPINGFDVDGPVLEPDMLSFTSYFPMPIRHGMTVGELAQIAGRAGRHRLQIVVEVRTAAGQGAKKGKSKPP